MQASSESKTVQPGLCPDPDQAIGLIDLSTNTYCVERISGCRQQQKEDKSEFLEFLVKWKGWDATHNTWEPLENFLGVYVVIDRYFRKTQRKDKKSILKIYKRELNLLKCRMQDMPVLTREISRKSNESKSPKESKLKKSEGTKNTKRSAECPKLAKEVEDIGVTAAQKKNFQYNKQDVNRTVISFPKGQSLTYERLKNIKYLKINDVIHPVFPEKVFEDGSIPEEILSAHTLPALNTCAYFVKMNQAPEYRLVFHDVGMRWFPVSLREFIRHKKEIEDRI